MTTDDAIDDFLAGTVFAVVGASADRSKYGNRVLRAYRQAGRDAIPVNPRGGTIEGLAVAPDLASLPHTVHGVSIITPPEVTEQIVDDAIALGLRRLWMQPGAESDAAIARARAAGIEPIHGGPCVLVVLGYRGG